MPRVLASCRRTGRVLALCAALAVALSVALAAPGTRAAAAPPDDGLAASTDSLFAAWNRPDSPGCVLGVVRDGRFVYTKACGAASLELGVPLTTASICDLGSVSKQFTAFCAQLLIQEGKLKRTDDIRMYLPELPDYDDRYALRPITIDHLFHHTSGLRDYNDLLLLAGHDEADHTTKQQALDLLCQQKGLNFRPGERFLYSNTNYFLLSVIVERVSGMSLRDFAARRVFGPLGMTHTQFNDACNRLVPGRAAGYAPGDSGFVNSMSDWEQTGDGAVLSSVEDLLAWVNNFETGAVGGREVIAALEKPGQLNNGDPASYASGLDTAPWRGLRCVRHNGAWAGYRAEIVRFPEQNTAIILTSNLATMNTTALCDRVAELWLAGPLAAAQARQKPGDDPTFGIETAPTVPLSPADLGRYVGRYDSEEAGVVEVTLAGGQLNAGGPAVRPTPLRPLGHGRFQRVGGRTPSCLVFEEGRAAAPGFQVLVRGRADRPPRFRRVEPWEPSFTDLSAMAGRYASEELGVEMDFDISQGRPRLRYAQHDWIFLDRQTTDTFACDLGTFRVRRDDDRRPAGFTVSTARAQGMEFVRGRWTQFHHGFFSPPPPVLH